MSIYSSFGREERSEPEDMDYVVMEGDFYCTHNGCRLSSEKALYFMTKKVLAWACPDGHESRSKDINL